MSEPTKPLLKQPKKLQSPKKIKPQKIKKNKVLGAPNPSPPVVVSLTNEVMEKKHPHLPAKLSAVRLSNNQKGRIRQVIKDKLKGVSEQSLPEILHRKIIHILETTGTLTDSDLRKIRVLYNMYKSAMVRKYQINNKESKSDHKLSSADDKDNSIKNVKREKKKGTGDGPVEGVRDEMQQTSPEIKVVQKVKGPKRYTVFLGNLPPDIGKEQIINHFSELSSQIVNVRIPKKSGDGHKSAMAYLELKDEHSYEMALSHHHTMLGNKRIKVLYTTQKKSKVDKAEAKSKSAKLIALNKSGQLIGSIPQHKKRSARRKKMKLARSKETENNKSAFTS